MSSYTWRLTSAGISDQSLVVEDFTVTTGASHGSFKLEFYDSYDRKKTICFNKPSSSSRSVTVSILGSSNANSVNCISDIIFVKQTLYPQINRPSQQWPEQLNQFLADSFDQQGPDIYIGISQNGATYW